jgi:hypothetical protein
MLSAIGGHALLATRYQPLVTSFIRRMPFYTSMTEEEQVRVIDEVKKLKC